ncbi:MAG: 2-hydroxychromene-2-carboxylate isomerase [Arenicella sp.]|jgi:2-hydroxychromene-2-carboxylate isomerase
MPIDSTQEAKKMRWYFDFISPYAYLQSTKLYQFSELQSVECVPVLFAGLLNHWQNIGPAEIDPKRQWTFRNCLWLAQRDKIEFKLPACHPFNPLPLLRLSIVHNNSVAVVQRLFNFVWAEGHLPQNTAAFAELLDELNTRPEELDTVEVKQDLQQNGRLAIKRGVFGVPSVEYQGDVIWGYEASDMVIAALQAEKQFTSRKFADADTLPQGIKRKAKSNLG